MGTLTAAIRRRAINSRAYASAPYRAAQMLNQLRRSHRAWPMFELKSGRPCRPYAAALVNITLVWPIIHEYRQFHTLSKKKHLYALCALLHSISYDCT